VQASAHSATQYQGHQHQQQPQHSAWEQQHPAAGQYSDTYGDSYSGYGHQTSGSDMYAYGQQEGHGSGGGKGWGGLLKGLGKTAAELSKKGLKAAQVRPGGCGAACMSVQFACHLSVDSAGHSTVHGCCLPTATLMRQCSLIQHNVHVNSPHTHA
jgi:hypothetical protein